MASIDDRRCATGRDQRRPAAVGLLAAGSLALLAACGSAPKAPPPPASIGAAGGGTTVASDATLQTCPQPLGTVRLQDGNANADSSGTETASSGTVQSIRLLLKDLNSYMPRGGGKGEADGFSIESLRLLIQQSNCLVIVDRGAAEAASSDEVRRARAPGGNVRDGANMGPGQEVAADFVLRAMVVAVGDSESSSFNVGALIPWRVAQGLTAGKTTTKANVQLVLSDVRAKIQLAVAQGEGSGSNTGIATSVLGRAGGVFGGGKASNGSSTSMSTVMLQAYADAYNKLVPALRGYKTQTVQGGLGAGGTLRVQGAVAPR